MLYTPTSYCKSFMRCQFGHLYYSTWLFHSYACPILWASPSKYESLLPRGEFCESWKLEGMSRDHSWRGARQFCSPLSPKATTTRLHTSDFLLTAFRLLQYYFSCMYEVVAWFYPSSLSMKSYYLSSNIATRDRSITEVWFRSYRPQCK